MPLSTPRLRVTLQAIVHKSAAVSEVIAQLAIEADDDPE